MPAPTGEDTKVTGVDRKAIRIAGGYALFGVLWIAFSDQAIVGLADDAAELTRLQTWKGAFYVVVTAALVFVLSRVALAREARLADGLRAKESEVRALNAELEERVRSRTAELEAANQALEAFAYSVSHDLKTPLRGIDGYSKLVLDEHAASLDEEARAYLGNVRKGVGQMQHLIDDLLEYSRLERRTPLREPVPLAPLARAVVGERAAELSARDVAVDVEVPELTVEADLHGLTLVLRNLLDNALKFTSAVSEPRIAIGARRSEAGVSLWVRDNGIGFDMKFHDRIFEMFSRLEHAECYAGTGLGLAMVRKAVQRMGGRVRAQSEPGHGATFFVEFAS